MIKQKSIIDLVNGSKTFTFNGPILTITSYYDSRKQIKLDLSKLTPEMLEELWPDAENDD